MMAENRELILLYQYQKVCRRRADVTKRLAELFSDPALELLSKHLTALEEKMASSSEAISCLRKNIKKLEGDRAAIAYHRKQSEEELYGGRITSPKELTQLERKIEEYRQAEGKVEEELLQAMYGLEEKEKELNDLQSEHARVKRKLETRKKEWLAEKETLEAEKETLEKEEKRLAALLPPVLKTRFERLKVALQGIVVAPVKDKTCGVCHVLLSSGILEKARKGGLSPPACENCGRLLIMVEEEN